ncbi:hypothetical protein SDC9_91940 [bioreactor metagenome]|uniref:Uncharacterized protein n=1 Tax=bioreactor metagenome TaxID=1076179 RepID=A0A645A671_9ZZZZ|nr:hypothetical protein [Proteiniphilum sp.]MEA4918165.1 hypothetical protein [Proteiniphilum sp.]
MISDKITKSEFVIQVLERDVKNIYNAQLLIARQNIYIKGRALKKEKRGGALIGRKTGRLLESLENPDYVIAQRGDKFIVSSGIVKHMRFLDMKRLGNRKIYNRQLWGILYNNSLRDIRQGYGKELYDFVGDTLRNAFGTSQSASTPSAPSSSGNSGGNSFDGQKYAKAKGRT